MARILISSAGRIALAPRFSQIGRVLALIATFEPPVSRTMSEEPPAKRIRKGTRSCQECRHRKVRCIWPSDNAQVCQGCLTRHRTCELQVEIVQSSDAPKLTSKARIAILEDQITKLWGAINGGVGSIATNPGRTQDNVADSIPSGSHSRNQSSPDSSNPSSPTNPPTHLLHLFDNDLLDSNGHEAVTPSTRMSSSTMSQESISLLKLLPSREDMVIIAANASAWLSWYKVLFSLNLAMGAGDKMLSNYDRVKSSERHPVPIATILLAVAITVQQAPGGHAMNRLRSITNPSAFLKDVSNLVEKVIVSNDDLIASLDGIRCALLFIRL